MWVMSMTTVIAKRQLCNHALRLSRQWRQTPKSKSRSDPSPAATAVLRGVPIPVHSRAAMRLIILSLKQKELVSLKRCRRAWTRASGDST